VRHLSDRLPGRNHVEPFRASPRTSFTPLSSTLRRCLVSLRGVVKFVMRRLRRFEVMVGSLAFGLATIAYLVDANTISFFDAVIAGIVWTLVVVRGSIEP